MLTDHVIHSGASYVPHPVLDKLFGGSLPPNGNASVKDVGSAVLVVVDARLGSADLEPGGVGRQALEAGVPLLIIAPNEGQLSSLSTLIGVTPETAAQAAFIVSSSNESEKGKRFRGTLLGYRPQEVEEGYVGGENPQVTEKKAAAQKGKHGGSHPCGCGGREARAVDTEVSNYTTLIESSLTRAWTPQPLALPDGLKYFQTTWTNVSYFTSTGTDDDHTFTNGQGSLSIAYTVWGFLSQSASSTSQYLIIEGSYNLNPGTLAGNDDETRGWLNVLLQSNVAPTSGNFNPTGHVPTNGVDSWNETLTLSISYANPLGGYQIYTYQGTVNQTIGSWSVQNSSSGTSEGSMWFVNTPLNGSNIDNDASDAFTSGGHVETFPSASTGTVTANEINSWSTSTLQTGNVTVSVNMAWTEAVFYATSCGLLVCYRWNVMWLNWTFKPTFSVNFASLNP
jgi:hypothetical protein